MRAYSNRGIMFGVIGALLLIAGIVMIVVGKSIDVRLYSDPAYHSTADAFSSPGDKLMLGGYFAAGTGAILLLIGVYLFIRSVRWMNRTVYNDRYDEVDDVMAQLAGNKTIFDIFHSEDRSRIFSFYRNNTCKFKEGDTVYSGRMEPLTWEAGHPTLWRITIDKDGVQETCEISKVEGNIRIKSAGGEEIFYRN